MTTEFVVPTEAAHVYLSRLTDMQKKCRSRLRDVVVLDRRSRGHLAEPQEQVLANPMPKKGERARSRCVVVAAALTTLSSLPITEQPGKPSVTGVPFECVF